MSDLKVDYQLLESTEYTLSSLVAEFQNMQAQESGYSWAMGSGPIAAAMDGFATNWNHNKANLVNSMQALGKMVGETLTQFKCADAKLASAQTTTSQPSTSQPTTSQPTTSLPANPFQSPLQTPFTTSTL
jgi:hypothetical protein